VAPGVTVLDNLRKAGDIRTGAGRPHHSFEQRLAEQLGNVGVTAVCRRARSAARCRTAIGVHRGGIVAIVMKLTFAFSQDLQIGGYRS
jgi:hypothetical protein